MCKIIKELLFYFIISIISIVLVAGLGYIGLPESLGLRLLLWIMAGAAAYLSVVFIPFFEKRKKRYYDVLGLMCPYVVVVFICLIRSENFDDYTYVSAFVFMASIPFIPMLFSKILNKLRTKQADVNQEEVLFDKFRKEEKFELVQVVSLLKISEYKARKLLKKLVEQKKVIIIKQGCKNYYKII